MFTPPVSIHNRKKSVSQILDLGSCLKPVSNTLSVSQLKKTAHLVTQQQKRCEYQANMGKQLKNSYTEYDDNLIQLPSQGLLQKGQKRKKSESKKLHPPLPRIKSLCQMPTKLKAINTNTNPKPSSLPTLLSAQTKHIKSEQNTSKLPSNSLGCSRTNSCSKLKSLLALKQSKAQTIDISLQKMFKLKYIQPFKDQKKKKLSNVNNLKIKQKQLNIESKVVIAQNKKKCKNQKLKNHNIHFQSLALIKKLNKICCKQQVLQQPNNSLQKSQQCTQQIKKQSSCSQQKRQSVVKESILHNPENQTSPVKRHQNKNQSPNLFHQPPVHSQLQRPSVLIQQMFKNIQIPTHTDHQQLEKYKQRLRLSFNIKDNFKVSHQRFKDKTEQFQKLKQKIKRDSCFY